MCGYIGKNLERQREQCVASQDRCRLVELAMKGQATPAHIVIVHARQVIMGKRLGMDTFDCCPDPQRLAVRSTDKLCRCHRQQGPEALPSTNHAIAHGIAQPLVSSCIVANSGIENTVEIPAKLYELIIQEARFRRGLERKKRVW